MDIEEWKAAAKRRIVSGEMTDAEWDGVLSALLVASEGSGIDHFDDVIYDEWNKAHPEPPGRTSDQEVYVGGLGWMTQIQ